MTDATEPDAELDKLAAAVDGFPDVLELRLRLIRLLAGRGRTAQALAHAAEALKQAPENADVRALIENLADGVSNTPATDVTSAPTTDEFDWSQAEADMSDVVAPEYLDHQPPATPAPREATKLDDVAGMADVKAQIELSFIGPLRNPELARSYGTSAGGGLLLYGPPGCGKTFIATAIAGELGARFFPVGVPDVVEMATGVTEQTLRKLFAVAREQAPAVIFFDEIDAIGQKRSQLPGASVLRQLVSVLLTELDRVRQDDGVFVLGATNHPWDVDSALRRPGRFDRMLFVSPPDADARAALIRSTLAGKPIAGIDLDAVVGIGQWISERIGRPTSSRAGRALALKKAG